jgi:hypothetical protein
MPRLVTVTIRGQDGRWEESERVFCYRVGWEEQVVRMGTGEVHIKFLFGNFERFVWVVSRHLGFVLGGSGLWVWRRCNSLGVSCRTEMSVR